MRPRFILLLITTMLWLNASADMALADTLKSKIDATYDEEERIEILLEASREYRSTSPQRSLDHARRALQQSRAVGYVDGEIRALVALGELYNFLGSMDVALQYQLDAVTLAEENKKMILLADAYNAVGGVYYNQEDYTRAFPYFSRALNLRRKYASDSLIAGALNNVGEIHRLQGEPKEAIKYFKESLELNRKLKNFRWAAINLNNLGDSYLAIGETEKAEKALFESLEFNESNDNIIGMSSVHLSMGELYAKLDMPEKAEFHLSLAYKHALESDYAKAIRDAAKILSEYYADKGEYQEALKYQKVFDRIKDSMLNEDRLKRQMLVREHFETEQKEREIEDLLYEKRINDLEVRRQQRENYVLIGSGVLLIVLLVVAVHQSRQRKRNNRLLQETLAQKEVLLKEIHHRVKNNLQLISSLLSLQADKISDPKALQAVQDSHARVRSMAILHQELYMRRVSGRIDVRDYMTRLMESVRDSFAAEEANIECSVISEDFQIEVDQAIPLGLIVNELVTNAFKYAFPEGQTGEIELKLRKLNGDAELVIRDNGRGLPDDFDTSFSNSLGLEIVQALTGQLDGAFSFEVNGGTKFKITFPVKA